MIHASTHLLSPAARLDLAATETVMLLETDETLTFDEAVLTAAERWTTDRNLDAPVTPDFDALCQSLFALAR